MTCIVIKDVFILTISLLAFSWCSTFYYIILYIIYIYIFFKSPGVSNCICVCVRAAGCFGRQLAALSCG